MSIPPSIIKGYPKILPSQVEHCEQSELVTFAHEGMLRAYFAGKYRLTLPMYHSFLEAHGINMEPYVQMEAIQSESQYVRKRTEELLMHIEECPCCSGLKSRLARKNRGLRDPDRAIFPRAQTPTLTSFLAESQDQANQDIEEQYPSDL